MSAANRRYERAADRLDYEHDNGVIDADEYDAKLRALNFEVFGDPFLDSPDLAHLDAQSQPADGIGQAVPGSDDLEEIA